MNLFKFFLVRTQRVLRPWVSALQSCITDYHALCTQQLVRDVVGPGALSLQQEAEGPELEVTEISHDPENKMYYVVTALTQDRTAACVWCVLVFDLFFFFFTILDLSANQMYFLLIFSIVVDGRAAQGSWFVASSQGGNGSQEGCYVTYSPDPSSLLWIRQKSVPDVFVHKRWKMFRLVGQIQSSLIILEGGCCTLLNFEHSGVWKPF